MVTCKIQHKSYLSIVSRYGQWRLLSISKMIKNKNFGNLRDTETKSPVCEVYYLGQLINLSSW